MTTFLTVTLPDDLDTEILDQYCLLYRRVKSMYRVWNRYAMMTPHQWMLYTIDERIEIAERVQEVKDIFRDDLHSVEQRFVTLKKPADLILRVRKKIKYHLELLNTVLSTLSQVLGY